MNRCFLLAAFLCACGARSGLLDPRAEEDGGVDAGLGGDGGSGALGGRRGFGGTTSDSGGCDGMSHVPPTVTVPHPPSEVDSMPALVATSGDDEQGTVVLAREPLSAPGTFVELRHASFAPWQPWPPTLDATYGSFAGATLSKDFRIARAADDEFALAAAHPNVVSLAPHAKANSSNPGATVTLVGATPAFVSEHGTSQHLVGNLSATLTELIVNVVDTTSGVTSNTATMACADSTLVAGAVPFQDGWLVAHSNGLEAPTTGSCSPVPEDAGPPMRIDIVSVSPTLAVEYRLGLELPISVLDLAVAPHPNGIYVVWQLVQAGDVAPIQWARYDATLAGFVGPAELSKPGETPFGLAATALGDRLAVAYPSGVDSPYDLVLRVLDPAGVEVATTTIAPPFVGPLALLGAPSTHSLLLGYRGGVGLTNVQLARFDCIP